LCPLAPEQSFPFLLQLANRRISTGWIGRDLSEEGGNIQRFGVCRFAFPPDHEIDPFTPAAGWQC
jgi:hypothetical protein